jgi:2-methylisocitrate lyase-like PEP mutase family enzyme
MTQVARFRELLRRDGMVVAPGAYDCITARLIERAGFDASRCWPSLPRPDATRRRSGK